MTHFHLGIMIGFFLGALAMFVALGIIHLYNEERQGKDALAGKQTARERLDGDCRLPYPGCYRPDCLPTFASEEQEPEEATTIYYLSILIE